MAGLEQSERVVRGDGLAGGPARRLRTTKYDLTLLILFQLQNWKLGSEIQEGTKQIIKSNQNAYLRIYNTV
jgi:hypothetical protein